MYTTQILHRKKFKFQVLIILLAMFQTCFSQTTAEKEIYNADFKWLLTIPEDFESVSAEDWAKMQNKGADAIEKTFNEELIIYTKTIFVFKNDQFNYFESNYQPFDTLVDGNYLESCNAVNNILLETFKAQMPDIKVETTRSVENIDGLEFQKFQIKALYPNNITLHILMYSRLFDKKELTINIMYVDPKKGEKMIENWKNSKFGK